MSNTPLVARFAPNQRGRDFVVGDLHGMFSLLERLLTRVNFDTRGDRLFAVGDLCDRGPDSERVLNYLDEPWFNACLGNHGDMLLGALKSKKKNAAVLWRMNGGEWGLSLDKAQQRSLLEAFSRLPLAMEIKNTRAGHVGIVHAEVPQGMAWQEFLNRLEANEAEICAHALWARSRITKSSAGERPDTVSGVDLVFSGHTILPEPLLFGNSFFIDTGAFLGKRGRLSMVELNQQLSLTQEPSPHPI